MKNINLANLKLDYKEQLQIFAEFKKRVTASLTACMTKEERLAFSKETGCKEYKLCFETHDKEGTFKTIFEEGKLVFTLEEVEQYSNQLLEILANLSKMKKFSCYVDNFIAS